MTITFENTGRRFNREWIFRHVSRSFSAGNAYAVLGSNGSGKSTLLQVLAGFLQPSEGQVTYHIATQQLPVEQLYRQVAIASPFLELYDDLSLEEALAFHRQLKPFRPSITAREIVAITGLERARHKTLRDFSSGMRQRVKLALAILSDVPLLLLDEPCSNLDAQGISWYRDLLAQHAEGRLIVVASNHLEDEIFLCGERLVMENLK